MPQTIILKNTTPSNISLDDIAITVPASGQIVASNNLLPEEIRRSADLLVQVNAGTIVIDDGVNELDVTSSQAFMGGGEISPAVTGSQAATSVQQLIINETPNILTQADAIVSTQPDLIVTSGTNQILLSLLAPPSTSSAVQARRTTSLDGIPLTWTDVTFNATDVETNTLVLEHDNSNTDRILVKADGLYQLSYAGDVDDEAQVRVRVNDSTVIPGSITVYGNPNDAVDLRGPLVHQFFAELSTGDFLTVQIQSLSSFENLSADFIFTVARMDGAKGPQGPVGPPGSSDKKQFHAFLNSSDVLLGSSFTPVPLDTQVIASGISHTPGQPDVTFNSNMLADVTYYITNAVGPNTRSESAAILQEDTGSGFVNVIGTESRMYHRRSTQNSTNASVRIVRQFQVGDKLRLASRGVSGATTGISAVNQACGLVIVDSLASGAQGNTGPQGSQGPTGPQGGPGNPNPALISNFPVQVVSGSNTITINSLGIGGVEFIKDNTESTTTSTTPIQKLRLTTSSLSAGTYRVGWSFEYGRDGFIFGGTDFNARLQIDNTTEIASYAAVHNGAIASNFWPASGFDYVALTAGVHTIDLDFWGETTGNTSRIRNSRLEIVRIA